MMKRDRSLAIAIAVSAGLHALVAVGAHDRAIAHEWRPGAKRETVAVRVVAFTPPAAQAPPATTPPEPRRVEPPPRAKPTPAPVPRTEKPPEPAPRAEAARSQPEPTPSVESRESSAAAAAAATLDARPPAEPGPGTPPARPTTEPTEDLVARYVDAVRERILTRRRYPALARKRAIEGLVVARLAIRADGRLDDLALSDGVSSLLRRASDQAIRSAAPYPPPPHGAIAIEIPLEYSLRDVR